MTDKTAATTDGLDARLRAIDASEHARSQDYRAVCLNLLAELSGLRLALQAVEALHYQVAGGYWCWTCPEDFPCETIRAITPVAESPLAVSP